MSETPRLPNTLVKCYMSQSNIDLSKAHESYCLYALPIKEGLWQEHGIPPAESRVKVNEHGIATANINGYRCAGPVPNYELVQALDAAVEKGTPAEIRKAKEKIKPHAFEITFVPQRIIHINATPPARVTTALPTSAKQEKPSSGQSKRSSFTQKQSKSGSAGAKSESKSVVADKEKSHGTTDKEKSHIVPASLRPRIAHRAKQFLA